MAGGTVSLALKLFDSVFKYLFCIIESSSCLHLVSEWCFILCLGVLVILYLSLFLAKSKKQKKKKKKKSENRDKQRHLVSTFILGL